MRRLKTTDLFAGMRLIKQAGMKEEVQRIALLAKNGKGINAEEVGIDLILGVIENLAEEGAEQKVYEFLSGPLEISVEELKDMDVLELVGYLKAYREVEDKEGWKAFFQSLQGLMR